MPRPNPGPRLALYGPDTRHGAKRKAGFQDYIWYIVWSERGEKREHSTGAGLEHRSQAEAQLRDLLDTRAQGWRGTRRPDQVTIADVLDLYGRERGPQVIDRPRLGQAIVPLVEWWGEQKVAAVTAGTCRAYAKDRMAEGRSADTARRELGVLRAAIRYCWKEGRLTQEVPVTLPEKGPARDLWLTLEDVALLMRAARAERKARLHLPQFILLSLYTGHRKRAVLGLQWQPNIGGGHVDLEAGLIDFQGRRKKTKKARGKPLISRKLAILLRYLRKRTRQYVLEANGQPIGDIKHSFASACQRAADLARARAAKAKTAAERQAWERSAARLGRAIPHTLRHTAVTWLVTKGRPLADVGAWVGMSTEMVERVYGHLASERLARVRAAVDRR